MKDRGLCRANQPVRVLRTAGLALGGSGVTVHGPSVRSTVRLSRKACAAPAHRSDLAVGVGDLGCGEDAYASWSAVHRLKAPFAGAATLAPNVENLVQEVGEQRGVGEVIAEEAVDGLGPA